MTTAVLPESRSVVALAKVEAVRYARHPLFLLGLAADAWFLLARPARLPDYYTLPIMPAMFVGLFGLVVMFRLTRSLEPLDETLGATPAGVQDRVRALCLLSLLPGALAAVSLLVVLARLPAVPGWVLGSWSGADRVVIYVGEIVVAGVGGPLLGVAAARWLRFRGAVALLVAGILLLVVFGEALTNSAPQAWYATFTRMVSPWAQFTQISGDGTHMASWLGSPWLWVAWTVALCFLAGVAALVKGAEGEDRAKLLRLGRNGTLVALALLALAVVLGPDQATLHSPAGVSRLHSWAVE